MLRSETNAEKNPSEVFDKIKKAILGLPGFEEVSFVFNGKVIKASQRSSEQYDSAERVNYDQAGKRIGKNTVSERYIRTHVQFKQGDIVIEVDYSPRTDILTDREGSGGRGSYQRREENFLIRGLDGKVTQNKKGEALDSNMELIADLCEALTSYKPNEGGLADLRSEYKERVDQAAELTA